MNKTNEEIKEDATISAQAEVDEDLEDVSAAGVVVSRSAADMGEVAEALTSSSDSLANLTSAGSYLAGIGFSIGAIVKFK